MHELRGHLEVIRAGILQVGPEQLHRPLVHEHGRVHVGGVHRVHPDEVLAEFDGEGAHQADHAVLGGDVVTGVRVGLEAPDRTGQNDRAALALGNQVRHTGFDGFPDAGKVDVDHVAPVVFAGLVQSLAAVADSGVGADDVQPAQLLDAAVHRRFQRVVIADVDLGGHDAAVQALDEVGRLGQVIGRRRRDLAAATDRRADVDRDDVGTFLRQAHRVAAALAASRPGDERDLALNSSTHDCTSPRRGRQFFVDRSGRLAPFVRSVNRRVPDRPLGGRDAETVLCRCGGAGRC